MNKITIIGTGPAGLTAAIYAARAQLDPVVYAGIQHGGQLTTTTEVENYPGFREGVTGPRLMEDMSAQAERFGAKIIYEPITRVDFSRRPLRLWADAAEVESRAVIIATGATARTLGLPGEAALMGRGLSTCATCDGFFYKGKPVVIAGGGDSAMEEALYLSNLASEVLVVHRRDEFRASQIMGDRVRENPKIRLALSCLVVDTISDEAGLTGVKIKDLKTGEIREHRTDGLFMAIGHKPNSDIFKDFVDLDATGYIKVHEFTKTRTPGVFAAGDISDPTFRQAVTAAGMGCQAAIWAQRYLDETGL